MALRVPDSNRSRRGEHLRPRTTMGAVSLWSLAGFLLLLVVTRLLVPTGILGQGGATFFSNLAIAIPMFASALLAVVTVVSGVASFFKGERSVLVGLGALVGFGVSAFAVAELVGPPT